MASAEDKGVKIGNQEIKLKDSDSKSYAEIDAALDILKNVLDNNLKERRSRVPLIFRETLRTVPVLQFGMVVNVAPLARVYYVVPFQGGPVRECLLLQHGSTGLFGIQDSRNIPPLTPVWFIANPNERYGYIIGTVPIFNPSAGSANSEIISPESYVGVPYEPELLSHLLLGATGIGDFSGRTPEDSLESGELCYSSETGGMIFLDSMMTFLRAGESCGIWAFFIDRLVRIAARNMQIWSAGHATEVGITSNFPFVRYVHGIADNNVEVMGRNFIGPGDPNNKNELINKPFFRDITIAGHPSTGELSSILLPTSVGGDFSPVAMSSIFRSYLGHIGLLSATGIHLVKSVKLSALAPSKPLYEDPKAELVRHGDRITSYLSNENAGAGAGQLPPQVSALDALALHELIFHGHAVMNKTKADKVVWGPNTGINGDFIVHQSLKTFRLTPQIIRDAVHGYKCAVYGGTARISITDDGSVVLRGATDSEIRLQDGCVYISAPLDIFLDAGRNVVLFGGRDAIIKANKDMDLTTSNGDMRLKAEHNLHMLGANAGSNYGVLIESRSSAGDRAYSPGIGTSARFPGIVMVSRDNAILLKGKYVIDYAAAQVVSLCPTGEIVRHASAIVDNVTCFIAQRFDQSRGENSFREYELPEQSPGQSDRGRSDFSPTVNFYTYGLTILEGEACVKGPFAASESVISGGNIFAGHSVFIDSGKAHKVGDLIEADSSRVEQVASQIINVWRPYYANTFHNTSFTLRSDADLRNSEFVYPHSYWSQAGAVWAEPPVITYLFPFNGPKDPERHVVRTYPFPGAQYYDNNIMKPIIIVNPTQFDQSMLEGNYSPSIHVLHMSQKPVLEDP